MAGGYTPAFTSLYTGTLYGKWPTAAVWASLLPLIDASGCIEMTHEAIAGMTGWPIDLLRQGIEQLEQPDPGSRSTLEEGRRLVRLDSARSWGWRAVNVQKYRQLAGDRNQVADGRNAEKVRRYKERHRKTPEDTAGHRHTPSDTNSYSDSYTDSNKEKNPDRSARASRSAQATRLPADFILTPERRAIAEAERADPDREFLNFTDHWKAASGSKARKNDWDATWRIWCRRAPDFQRRPAGTAKPKYVPSLTTEELEAREAARAGK